LIEDVERMWIEGVLQRSPYQELLRTLDRSEPLKSLADPWRFRLQGDDASPLPSSTSISELYAQSTGSLSLLGQSGAGKTTLLLTLARELLARARSDDRQPIPVVFNLSTWRASRRTLDGWLFDELANRYGVERHSARPWLRADLLALLLDDLDELVEEERAACIEAINVYYREHPGVQIVVCCREDEYLAQPARLDLHNTAQIQPLSDQQVEAYFDAVGEQAEDIHQIWRTDASLHSVLQTPLLLTIVGLVHHSKSTLSLPIAETFQQQREQILAAYVEQRMGIGDGDGGLYSKEQARHWLEEIARQMQMRNQAVFYLEHIQPDWLPTAASRLALSALFGLIAGLAVVLPVALLLGGWGGLGIGIVAGLATGLLWSLLTWFRSEIVPVDNILAILRGLRRNILVWLLGGLLMGVLGVSVGGLLYGLLILLLYGLVVWVVVGPDDQGQRERPGGRIWRSGQNGLAIGALAAIGFGLLGVPFAALYIGLIIGVFAGLTAGGAVFLRHFLLCLLLSRSKNDVLPQSLINFLNYAADHSLLYKVGGGYIFPHRSLLDYFAT
jgi:energy-coupling factor transporter ATP-binding protein EcfA2